MCRLAICEAFHVTYVGRVAGAHDLTMTITYEAENAAATT
jgi:hypothetical protein